MTEHALELGLIGSAWHGTSLGVLEGMSESFERLGVPATPYAVRVGQGGTVADAAPIGSPEALRGFIEREEVSHELV